jgi:hypothetical protein
MALTGTLKIPDGQRTIYVGLSGLLCIGVHLLVMFFITTFSRADDYLSTVNVTPGPWIIVLLLPEAILVAGALTAIGFPRQRWRIVKGSTILAFVGIAAAAVWAVLSRENSLQTIWLFEELFG